MPHELTIIPPQTDAADAEVDLIAGAAGELIVSNEDSHALALGFLKRVVTAERHVKALFADSKKDANRAHKTICALEKKLLTPLLKARSEVSSKCSAYEMEQRRIAEAARLEAERAARFEAEERQIAEAAAAEDAGDSETAEAILNDEPTIVAPVIAPAPEVAKVESVSTRETWSAEVVDLAALVKHVAAHPEHSYLLEPKMTELNAMARRLRGELRLPGVRSMMHLSKSVRTA